MQPNHQIRRDRKAARDGGRHDTVMELRRDRVRLGPLVDPLCRDTDVGREVTPRGPEVDQGCDGVGFGHETVSNGSFLYASRWISLRWKFFRRDGTQPV